jgi:hypothetical protein
MWGKPPSFFQKLALEANQEESATLLPTLKNIAALI